VRHGLRYDQREAHDRRTDTLAPADGLDDLAKCSKLDWELASDPAANADELSQWEQNAFDGGARPDLIIGADIVRPSRARSRTSSWSSPCLACRSTILHSPFCLRQRSRGY